MNLFNGIVTYFQGVAAEVRKVSWPTFSTVMHQFFAVVIGLALFAAFVTGVDYVFIKAVALVIK